MYNTLSRLSVDKNILTILGNFTTNLAEAWLHMRCKFDGGKQINRSQSGSWQVRCAGAGLRFNEGAAWGPNTWQKILSRPPSDVFMNTSMAAVARIIKDRKRKAATEVKIRRKRAQYNSTDNSLKSRQAYSR